MKTLAKTLFMLFIIWLVEFIPNKTQAQEVSFQVFYDDLSPYGRWINDPPYGYVWIPSTYGFIPYCTSGYWVYTDDDGWVWVSDYDWGWAPFHYGCWEDDPTYGWFWIPGEVWAPAWVTWTYCNGYYGWAPLGYQMSTGYSNIPANRWVFVDEKHIADRQVSRYYAPRSQNVTYLRTATVIRSNHGPAKTTVEKSIGHSITPVTVKASSRPGQSLNGKSLSIYRPAVSKTTSAQPHPVPAKVADTKSISKHSSAPHTTTNHSAPVNNQPSTVQHSSHSSSINNGVTHNKANNTPQHVAPAQHATPQHSTSQSHVVHHVHHTNPPAQRTVPMQAPAQKSTPVQAQPSRPMPVQQAQPPHPAPQPMQHSTEEKPHLEY